MITRKPWALRITPLKTSDHVSRYRRDIIEQLQNWQMDSEWLISAADELALQSRLSPAQAEQTLAGYLQFIIHQLEGLDPLLEDIDQRHAQYLRTSLRQIRYQLGSADGSFKDRLVSLARQLSAMKDEGEEYLPPEAPGLRQHPVDVPDLHSYYTPPQRRAPFHARFGHPAHAATRGYYFSARPDHARCHPGLLARKS